MEHATDSSCKLEDFLTEDADDDNEFNRINVDEMIAKSLAEAGVPVEHNDCDAAVTDISVTLPEGDTTGELACEYDEFRGQVDCPETDDTEAVLSLSHFEENDNEENDNITCLSASTLSPLLYKGDP